VKAWWRRWFPPRASDVPSVFIDPLVLDNFIDAFGSGGAGCVRECACGRVFFNSNGGWTWEEGELEQLQADPNASDLDYSVSAVIFEGVEYAADCICWRPRAARVIGFIHNHDREIAEFLTAEKRRLTVIAQSSPVVHAS
jgi:hypothetical protein